MSAADRLAHCISLVQLRQGLDIEEATYAVVGNLRGSDDQKADLYAFIVEQQKAIPADLGVSAASLQNLITIDRAVGANPASDRPFDLSRYFDPSFLAAK